MKNGLNKPKLWQKNLLSGYKLIVFVLEIVFSDFIAGNEIKKLINGKSEINLIIQGNGNQRFLCEEFNNEPSEVFVNGILQDNSCKKVCYLTEEINNITLIYNYQLETCNSMFKNVNNMIEIDLSLADISNSKSLAFMFEGCSNLEKINFGNINTSSVTTMTDLFKNCYNLKSIDMSNLNFIKLEAMAHTFLNCYNLERINFRNINTPKLNNMNKLFMGCSKLKSLDLSYFNTSKVTGMSEMFSGNSSLEFLNISNFNTSIVKDMSKMFSGCSSLSDLDLSFFNTTNVEKMTGMFNCCVNLKYLDLSNFISPKLKQIDKMFYNCSSLVYLNLKNFQIQLNDSSNLNNVFYNEPNYTKYCIDDNKTSFLLLGDNISNCSDNCFIEDIKIDSENNICIDSCNQNNYQYEYNNICYRECKEGTYTIFCEGNECDEIRKCNGLTPEGYYLDTYNETYKRCFQNCKYCYGPGDETYNNCTECIANYMFLNDDSVGNTNCYEQCPYFYYFDDNNIYHCTENKSCPIEYNKFIEYRNKCIDDCGNDSVYKYEYNGRCEICPNGEYLLEESEDLKCYNSTPEGYYFEQYYKIYAKCFQNCKFCIGSGDKTKNNCKECISNYTFLNESFDNTNCYEKCPFYYYLDNNNNYYCTNNDTCPIEYSKFVEFKNKCIDYCINDNIYIYEFNNNCYSSCPEGTYELKVSQNKICFNLTIEGYYLDEDKKIYKKCHQNCKFCHGSGNEENNN